MPPAVSIIAQAPDMPPFVRGGSWWAVSSTGDYEKDNRVGAACALAFLDWTAAQRVHDPDAPPSLGMIVSDMIERRASQGLVIGFFEVIEAACRPALAMPGAVDRMRFARAKRAAELEIGWALQAGVARLRRRA